MRVCFLALHAPGQSPSQRYRVEAFLPRLRSAGIQVDYEWILDREDLKIFYGHASLLQKARVSAAAAFKRLLSILRTRRTDLFLVQREAYFLFAEWSEVLASLSAPIVFDFDDAIWIHSISEANRRFSWLKNVDKIPRIVRRAQAVVAGNEHLASWARHYSTNVHVIPTCVDTDHFFPWAKLAGGPVTLSWSGSPSTFAHLRLLLPALQRVGDRYGDQIRIRVMGDPSFSYAPLKLLGEAWSPDAELALLRETDIGLMPLPNDEWTLGKCGLKGLLSMAMGTATVMSPFGVAKEMVTDRQNGLLAETEDEWVDALCTLIRDAGTRHALGTAARATVVERYSVARWAPVLSDLLFQSARR